MELNSGCFTYLLFSPLATLVSPRVLALGTMGYDITKADDIHDDAAFARTITEILWHVMLMEIKPINRP